MKKYNFILAALTTFLLGSCNSPQLQSGGWIIPMLFGIGSGVFLGNYLKAPKEQRKLSDLVFGCIVLVIGIVIYIIMSRDKVPVPAL